MSTTETETRTKDRRESYSDQLATLDEETKTKIQIEEIHERTVRPGMMRVPVNQVSTSEESEKVVIDVDHPLEGEIRFHLDKPTTWDPNNELVRFLGAYDMSISGIYTLQTHDVYIEQDPSQRSGWGLAYPPEALPRRTKAAGKVAGGVSWLVDRVAWVTDPAAAFLVLSSVGVAVMVTGAWALGYYGGEPEGPIAVGVLMIAVLGVMLWLGTMAVAGVVTRIEDA